MSFVKVKPLEEVSPGNLTEVSVANAQYVLCNVDGAIYCVNAACPHAGGPLGQGDINGSVLVCPWHGWEFDCRTGLNDSDECLRLETYPVAVEDGFIHIDVPCPTDSGAVSHAAQAGAEEMSPVVTSKNL
jgi:nitrite reductase (NADH) small subunit